MDCTLLVADEAVNNLIGYGLLGLLGLVCVYAVKKFFDWVLAKLDEKDKRITEQQAAHDRQLDTIYTQHKSEIAAMNAAFISKLEGMHKQTTLVVAGTSNAIQKMEETLSKSFVKIGERLEAVEDGQIALQREMADLKSKDGK